MRNLIATLISAHSLTMFTAASALVLASCGTIVNGGVPRGNPGGTVVVYDHPEQLGIPEGHLPPPGQCKIWLPGVPPGQQGHPGDCDELARRMPLGAWLVHKDRNNPEHIEVFVYHEHRPGRIVIIRYHDAETGRFIRATRP